MGLHILARKGLSYIRGRASQLGSIPRTPFSKFDIENPKRAEAPKANLNWGLLTTYGIFRLG